MLEMSDCGRFCERYDLLVNGFTLRYDITQTGGWPDFRYLKKLGEVVVVIGVTFRQRTNHCSIYTPL